MKNSPAIAMFIFDLAGTTLRDDGLVLRAFQAVGQQSGLPVDESWVRARMGAWKGAVFREMLRLAGRAAHEEADLVRAFDAEIARQVIARPVQPLPGALHAIDALRARGIRVGFNTGFTRQLALSLLAPLGWPVDLLVASDEVAHGRPAPDMILEAMRRAGVNDPRHVGVAGDTPSDLRAGAAAGCAHIVGVGHGTHTLDELRAHPHTALLPDLHTLPEVLDERA